MGQGRGQHVLQLGFVARGHDHQARDMAQKGQVVHAVVRGPVLSDQAAPVQAEGHVQILQADVVHDLIVGTLHEGRIDGHHGLHALRGQPGGKGHGVLLADADIEKPFRKPVREAAHPGALGHGGGDGHDALVLFGQLAQRGTEDLGVAGQRTVRELSGRPGLGLEAAHPVEKSRVGFGRRVALALLGQDMDQNGPFQFTGLLKDIGQHAHVVPLQGADVGEAERLEEHARREETFEGVLAAAGVFGQIVADFGDLAHDVLGFLLEALHPALGQLAAEE